jgi:hypothetical protein
MLCGLRVHGRCHYETIETIETMYRRATSYKQANSVAFSPQANYIDWAASTCRRILVSTFADRELLRGQRGGSPTAVNLFSRQQPLFLLSSSSSFMLTRAQWNSFQTQFYTENLVAPGNRTRDLWVCSQKLWPLDHRGGTKLKTRSCFILKVIAFVIFFASCCIYNWEPVGSFWCRQYKLYILWHTNPTLGNDH